MPSSTSCLLPTKALLRCVELRGAKSLSTQFVSKLVKACRHCMSNHPLELYLTYWQRTNDLRQFVEQVRQGTLPGRLFDETRVWEFQFDDPHGLEVKIRDSRGGWGCQEYERFTPSVTARRSVSRASRALCNVNEWIQRFLSR